MRNGRVFFIVLTLAFSGCNPSPEAHITQPLPTASELIHTQAPSATLTATPTHTPTQSPTPTSTFTATFTPAPTQTAAATLTPLGGGPGEIACSACGDWYGISVVNLDGTVGIPLTDKGSMGVSFAWSGNGERLAFFTVIGSGDQARGVTCLIDATDLTERCLEVGGGSFALSPDGTQLAASDYDPEYGLYMVDVDSGEKRLLAGGDISSSEWSPDGSRIVYGKGRHVYVINRDGSQERVATYDGGHPIWSPDGNEIAYINGAYSSRSIILLRADGTKERLTPEMPLSNHMKWTADGKYIVFLVISAGSAYNPEYDLYAVEVASKSLTRLTNDHNVKSYTLSPDGTLIALTQGYWWNDECTHSYIIGLDGSLILEWQGTNCLTEVGPWRP